MQAVIAYIKANSKKLLFRFIVVYPIILGSFYFTFIASDQYVTTAHFTVKGSDDTPKGDMLANITGVAGQAGAMLDVELVKEFIKSPEAIEKMRQYFDLKKIYGSSDADWLSRLSSDASKEDTLEYWQDQVNIEVERLSGIAVLSIAAFTPDQAKLIADSILKASEQFVNRLSEQVRQDTLKMARDELRRSETRLSNARHAVREFRDREKSIDPDQSATAKLSIVTQLEGELAKAEAQLNDLLAGMNPNAPKVRAAQNLVDALREQISKERSRWTKTTANDKKNVSQLMYDYEQLLTEQGFAQTAHESALGFMEQARVDASKQHKYLAVISRPYLPEESLLPERARDILTLIIGCFLLWGILSLIIAAVKDHAGWV